MIYKNNNLELEKSHYNELKNIYVKGQKGPLGIYAKYVSPFTNTEEAQAVDSIRENEKKQLKKEKFKIQRMAGRLLPNSRVNNCLWALTSNLSNVDVIHNSQARKARFTNLQTCGSVWDCPCCSSSISEKRRVELNDLLVYARANKFFPIMLTLTVKHNYADNLANLLDSLKEAKRRMAKHKRYKKVKEKLIGTVTATEVTGGGVNGWHPHFHIILILKTSTEEEALALVKTLKQPWLVSLRAEGLEGSDAAFQVQNASAAGKYITKWGAAEELTLAGKKKGIGAGRTPFQLLADYADDDSRAGFLFQEYARAFKGRRQLVWSNGLKKLAKINEKSDDEIAAEEVRKFEESLCDHLVHSFTPAEWKEVRHNRADILSEAEESFIKNNSNKVDYFSEIKTILKDSDFF